MRSLLVIGAMGLLSCATTGAVALPQPCPVSGIAATSGGNPFASDDLPPIPFRARARVLDQARLAMGYDLHAPGWPLLVGSAADGLNASVGVVSTCQSVNAETAYRGLSTAMLAAYERTHLATEDGLVKIAATSMTAALKDGSRYWTRTEVKKAPRADLEPYFGLVVGKAVPFPVVVLLQPGSPAHAAGIGTGEQILSIDGVSMEGRDGHAVMDVLAAVPDRDVVLELASAGEVRRVITLNRGFLGARRAIGCRILDRSILYLRVAHLGPAAPSQIRQAALSAGEMSRRLIVDLRGAEDGSPITALEVVDLFVPSAEIAQLIQRRGRQRLTARTGDPLEDSRLVVLVDRGTRGAGELIALAAKETRRGWVLGEKTAGESDLFLDLRLPAGDVIRLLMGRVTRPDGVGKLGEVEPDVLEGAAPAERGRFSDLPCPGTLDTGEVRGDALIGRGVQLLEGSPPAGK